MKKIFHITTSSILLAMLFIGLGCSKNLDKSPLDEFDTRTFWTSEENAFLALTAIYRGSLNVNVSGGSPSDWWSHQALQFLDMASDNAYHGQGENSAYNKLSNGTLTSSLGFLRIIWQVSYDRVARCNDFLENIGRVPMNEERKKRMIAETRFIRACQYFYLSQHFGEVPLVTRTLSPEEANTVHKNTVPELITFLIEEYTASAANLPLYRDIPAAEMGRANKQVALAFLGRTYLAAEMFEEAANTYKAIIDYGDNIIDPDYKSIFLEENENSAENIFSVQFLPNVFANAIMQNTAPRSIGGFTFMNPMASLMEAYQFTDGSEFSYTDPRYDYTDIGKNRDPRLRYTIFYNRAPFMEGMYISHPDSAGAPDQIMRLNSKTGYLIRKYIDETATGNLRTDNGGNTPVIRYAEVLLSYLEAKLEAGHTIDEALLDETINKVRTRPTVNMPRINETNPDLLRPILRNERRVELALEGIRYWDLLRWKIAGQVLNADFYGHPYPDARATIRKKNASAPADPFKRWFVTTRNFRVGTDEYWPIPQAEVAINPNLQ